MIFSSVKGKTKIVITIIIKLTILIISSTNRSSSIQASRVSVSFVVCSASWDRKRAPSLEWQPFLCLLYANISIISNICVKEMKRENNLIRLPLETWCSLSVP